MSAGWDILQGNPAPGSPAELDVTVRAFTRVSVQAEDARSALNKVATAVDPSIWQGTAANAFRDSLDQLPDQLAKVGISYADAARALRDYCATLTSAQARAAALRQTAEDAAAEIARAESRARDAQDHADAAERRRRDATIRRDTLRRQLASTTDASMHAQVANQLASADAAVRRAQGDHDQSCGRRDAHRRAADSAREHLSRTIAQAKRLFQDVTAAAEAAARLIEAAESEAQLPNWLEQRLTEAKEILVTYGPVLVDTLQLAATLFSIAAAVLPIGAPIFLTASLICGGAALLLNIGITAASPAGFTTAKLLELGLQALTVAAAACGLGAISNLKWAATASKVIDVTSSAGNVAKGYVDGGVGGAVTAAGCVLLGKGVAKVGGAALKGVAAKLTRDDRTSGTIAALSRQVRAAGNDGLFHGRIKVDPMAVRQQQALLTGKAIPPGGFQFGNTAGRGVNTPLNHNPTAAKIEDAFEDAVGEPAEPVLEWVRDEVIARIKAGREAEPELSLPQE